MNHQDNKIEKILSFIDSVDEMIGSKSEEEVEQLFYQFASKTQPHALWLLLSIDDAYENEGDFLGEVIVLTYCLHKFYKDKLGLSPLLIEESEIDDALPDVENFLGGSEGKEIINDRNWDEIPLISGEIPGYFLRIFVDLLDELADEGSINKEMWLDLLCYFLTLLRVIDQRFPDIYM